MYSFSVYSTGQVTGCTRTDLGHIGQQWLQAMNASIPFVLQGPGNPDEGIYFDGSITTPLEFALGNGQLNFSQTITPDLTRSPGSNGKPWSSPFNFLLCIDGSPIYNQGGGLPADGSEQYEGDGPGLQVFVTASMSDQFTMYLLFQPPDAGVNTGTTNVALSSINWSACGTATWNPGLPGTWTYATVPVPAVVANGAVPTSTLPSWKTTNVFEDE
jgi:hypothetical protein